MKRFFIALLTGGALAYFLDPKQGKRRRNITRDRGMATFRRLSGSSAGTAKYVSGRVAGLRPHSPDNPNPDDATLKDRVESEVLRDPKFDRAPINFNVEDGVVVIRGELQSQGDIDALVSRVRGIPHVKGVESYLHLPGTPAPNKEESLRIS
jgi:osmotically-inducible protein OsmY